MLTQTTSTIAPAPFTHAELRALRTLRVQYRRDRDLFTKTERAHLRFLRWLVRSGRLMP